MASKRAVGSFAAWLVQMESALAGEADATVACDGCTACCTSSQFVHIGADETEALAAIPDELLFDAPASPAGAKLMGYDEQGRCPMLAEHGCSIYEVRPRTCRTFDCRIFPAAGIDADAAKPQLVARAREWVFEETEDRDVELAQAVRRAAAHHVEQTPQSAVLSPSSVAVYAVRHYRDHLERG